MTLSRPADQAVDPALLTRAAACLADGGTVLLPTDTVFGLAARPDRPAAVAGIFALKARPVQKNLPVMVANGDQLAALGARIDAPVQRLMASPFCPGPLTLALALDPARAPAWLAGRDEIAFRIPDDAFLLALLAQTGPLLVTSANRSGQPTPQDLAEALAQLAGAPDMVVAGTVPGATPSTLVNCRHSPPVIERLGAVSAQALAPFMPGAEEGDADA
ncbi:MAG: L-threonylcarbamoyladenylate synthase [Pararhodobacter sp.]|nr:L-threonylcarbamoyladenylate synthase [Pararhodobacter sp.]